MRWIRAGKGRECSRPVRRPVRSSWPKNRIDKGKEVGLANSPSSVC